MAKLARLIRRIPIRLRLALWYILTLALVLSAYNIHLRIKMGESLKKQVDTSLKLAMTQASDQVIDGQLSFADPAALDYLTQDFTIYLLDANGDIADQVGADMLPLPIPHDVGYMSISEPDHDDEEFEHNKWRVYTQPVGSGWIVVVHSLEHNQATIRSLEDEVRCTLPAALLFAGMGGYWLAARGLRPIDRITRMARTINTQDLTRRIRYDGVNDEVGRLARTFDSMLDRLQAGFEREQRFTSDAAHELRTPLTALKGQIGVTLSQPRTPENYQGVLREMEQQVDRLIRLSSDLLFMARLDHHQQLPEQVDLSDLLAVVVDLVRPLADDKPLDLVVDIAPGLVMLGHMDLLIRLFTNLLDNAIKYTPAQGRVSLCAAQESTYIEICVLDSGPGIAPEHLPRLFERFYRVASDRSRADGGAGLGLAIAHEITVAHGGVLIAQSVVGSGSTFTVRFPQNPHIPQK
jgi:heavy metal sensor kinase